MAPADGAAATTPPPGGQVPDALSLARWVLQLADLGGMPDTFWQSDSRVTAARAILGVAEDARYSQAELWWEADGRARPGGDD
jgi:hypothetical protein